MKKEYGFSLIEIMVSLVIFSIIMTAVGTTFYGFYQDWERQKKYLEAIENARWALQVITDHVRQEDKNQIKINPSSGSKTLKVKDDTYAGPKRMVRFVRVNRLATEDMLRYRHKQGAGGWTNAECANFIVDNPSGVDHFTWNNTTSQEEVVVEITVRPNPAASAGRNNNDYTLRTAVRMRN
jgi:prepilin-type N-terminal cleavage/methylation domain-containing protein